MVESQRATVVLVPGAGAGAWTWEPLGKELDERGIEHMEVDLPTFKNETDAVLKIAVTSTANSFIRCGFK